MGRAKVGRKRQRTPENFYNIRRNGEPDHTDLLNLVFELIQRSLMLHSPEPDHLLLQRLLESWTWKASIHQFLGGDFIGQLHSFSDLKCCLLQCLICDAAENVVRSKYYVNKSQWNRVKKRVFHEVLGRTDTVDMNVMKDLVRGDHGLLERLQVLEGRQRGAQPSNDNSGYRRGAHHAQLHPAQGGGGGGGACVTDDYLQLFQVNVQQTEFSSAKEYHLVSTDLHLTQAMAQSDVVPPAEIEAALRRHAELSKTRITKSVIDAKAAYHTSGVIGTSTVTACTAGAQQEEANTKIMERHASNARRKEKRRQATLQRQELMADFVHVHALDGNVWHAWTVEKLKSVCKIVNNWSAKPAKMRKHEVIASIDSAMAEFMIHYHDDFLHDDDVDESSESANDNSDTSSATTESALDDYYY